MALFEIAPSLPINSIAIHPLQRKFSFLKTTSFDIARPIQCKSSSSINVSTESQTIQSPSTNYSHSVWHYDYIQSLSNEFKNESYMDQIGVLKKEVKVMLSKVANNLEKIELIDVLQRLGVAYHFKDEIRNILDNNYQMETFKRKKDLYATSLEFRLFRQYGYDISTDVFLSFINETDNFKDVKSLNVEGILSLYEASFLALEHETILDNAKDFTSKFLKEYMKKNSDSNYISLLIDHALEVPIHRRVPRWEHRWFIQNYKRNPNFSPTLLRFAKLNFNMLQSIHQEEVKEASRWWKSTGLVEKLSFFRDRLVENYFWGLGMNYAPELGYFRINIAKVNCLITTFDDIYDMHGTLEELELFTDAIERWDVNAMENLPHYMKMCFSALNNFVNDVAYETLKEKGNNILPYLRRSWTDLFKGYIKEARWYHNNKHIPSFEEYIENSWATIGATTILANAYFMVPDPSRNEDLFISGEYPNMIRHSSMLLRLYNDIGSAERESETGDIVKAVENYIKNRGVSESEGRDYIMSLIGLSWKMMDKEIHENPKNYPQSFLDIVENLPKVALFFYEHDDGIDGYTVQDPETSSRLLSLIMQPIPMEDD